MSSKILCIDVGGTRIKAAVMSGPLGINELKMITPSTMRSLGWLNGSLPKIISVDHWAGMISKISDDYLEIAICVPGPVKGGQFYRNDRASVPRNLQSECQKYAKNKKVRIYKDADAWMAGAIAFRKLSHKTLKYPAIALIFGTGVGLSAALDETSIQSLEITELPIPFEHLAEGSGCPIDKKWKVHDILGKQFFEWVDNHQKEWDYDRVRKEYSKRVVALFNDIAPHLSRYAGNINTLIFGGGNAEYISISHLSEKCGVQIKSLYSRDSEVNPDVVPLVGLYELAVTGKPSITVV